MPPSSGSGVRAGRSRHSVADYQQYKARWVDTGREVLPEEWASSRAVQRGEMVVGQLLEIDRFDGGRAFVLNSAAPILDEGGATVGCAVAIQDISHLVETERALARSEDELRDANVHLAVANDELRRTNQTLEARVDARTQDLTRRTAQLQALTLDLTRAEERERQRVAEVIHDHLQQLLSVARINLGMAMDRVGRGRRADEPDRPRQPVGRVARDHPLADRRTQPRDSPAQRAVSRAALARPVVSRPVRPPGVGGD